MSDPPEFSPTDRSLPIALLRARETVMGPIREMLSASGVSEQKWRLLRVLHEQGPMDLTALSRAACLLMPSLTRMIRPMQAEGLIRREVPAGDRRRVVLAVTPQGLDLTRRHAPTNAALVVRVEAAFGADRVALLLDLLNDLQRIDLGPVGQTRSPKRGRLPPDR